VHLTFQVVSYPVSIFNIGLKSHRSLSRCTSYLQLREVGGTSVGILDSGTLDGKSSVNARPYDVGPFKTGTSNLQAMTMRAPILYPAIDPRKLE
jgi:hypothetical protein